MAETGKTQNFLKFFGIRAASNRRGVVEHLKNVI
jgi:hypothetical protein